MAATVVQSFRDHSRHHSLAAMANFSTPKPLRVCFSYAAYAKNLVHRLYSSNIPVEQGLSEAELSDVESSFGFTFPPDLRLILQEGLPVSPGFPNWRSSSKQQLEILVNLPILGICKEVLRNGFWVESWGERPDDVDHAVKLAKGFLKKAPILVPIYRSFYIPSTPCMAGNPVFHVHAGDIRLWSFDIAGFFHRVEFRLIGGEDVLRRPRLSNLFSAPAWAATEARRIEFWSEMAEKGESEAARFYKRGWWSGDLGCCLDEVCWRLRDGGWQEKDVREMMMMDGCDEDNYEDSSSDEPPDRKYVEWCVTELSLRLLRAGWSTEDVVESLGHPEDCHRNEISDGDSCFDLQSKTTWGGENS